MMLTDIFNVFSDRSMCLSDLVVLLCYTAHDVELHQRLRVLSFINVISNDFEERRRVRIT